MSLLDGFRDVVGIGTDIFNTVQSVKNQNYMKDVQKKTWEREDSAIQRRVADLRAAGLSPTLAAGSAASTSSPINVGVPKFDGANAMRAVEYGNMKAQRAVTEAQKDLLDVQISNADASGWKDRMVTEVLRKDASEMGVKAKNYVYSEIDRKIAENMEVQRESADAIRNSDIARAAGISTNSQEAIDNINLTKTLGVDKSVSPWLNTILSIVKTLK